MKKLIIALSILVVLTFAAGCSSDPSEKVFKEAKKQAEELKKLSLVQKFDRINKDTTILESRALLGAPTYVGSSKLGELDIVVYIWEDNESNSVGAAFAGAKLMEKLDKEQLEFFKSHLQKQKK